MTAVRAVVAKSLRDAATSNDANVPPVAVLWADPAREWEPAIASLQEAIPVLVLGDYDVSRAQGPAIWLRAVLAASDIVDLPAHLHAKDDKNPWVIYLPGMTRGEVTDLASMPDALRPLADVAMRSTWWPGPASQAAWTPHSFLASKHGANLDLATDAATKTALTTVLRRLLDEDVDDLRAAGRLTPARLHELALPDTVRPLLQWIGDPEGARAAMGEPTWAAFTTTVTAKYGVDPRKDTPISAAAQLGTRAGDWGAVWDRFADSPRKFPGVREALDKARPDGLFGADPHPDSWPSWNGEEEDALRTALHTFADPTDLTVARTRIAALAETHHPRRDTVWADLGEAPLAQVVGRLAVLAHQASVPPPGGDLGEQIGWYVSHGHQVDRAALEILGGVASQADRTAVLAALDALYDPWVDDVARAFQAAAVRNYPARTGLDVPPSTCVLFVDALRFDLAERLQGRLYPLWATLEHRLAAFPTVTPTGQPAVAPVSAGWAGGPDFSAGDDKGRPVSGTVLRNALKSAGVQYLDWRQHETGDPTGVAWTQTNTIDELGHAHGHVLAGMLDQQLDMIAERIRNLVAAGWARVVVVTDHGFLLPAAPATKVGLPLAVTEGGAARKPRVARLKADAQRPGFPVVPWTWDSSVDMVSAPGSAAFEAGTVYEHGGLSPQECVLPVLTVTPPDGGSPVENALAAAVHAVRWNGQRCRIDFTPEGAELTAEIRTAAGDPGSVVGGPKAPSDAGEFKILVDEESASAGTAAFVVLLNSAGVVVAQKETTVGGTA